MHSKRPTINVASNDKTDTKYQIVRQIASKLGFPTTLNEKNWDIGWQDSSVSSKFLSYMKPFQKINHFPGIFEISRKNNLAKNLKHFTKAFPEDYNFTPDTWTLPQEILKAKQALHEKDTLIVKPDNKSQGRGIYLVNNLEDIEQMTGNIAQKYVKDPLLIDGLKFDLRIYVVVISCDPLVLYINKEGIARFATESYKEPANENFKNVFMHLTNYAINKKNRGFVQSQGMDDNCGHKRSLRALFKQLLREGKNVEELWQKICDLAVKTIISVQPYLAKVYKSAVAYEENNSKCFEILGFDILIDKSLKPWLLEVNFTPSFTTDSDLDREIKGQVIMDTLHLVSSTSRHDSSRFNQKTEKSRLRKKPFCKNAINPDQEEIKRDLQQIYPIKNVRHYAKFFEFSERFWNTLHRPSDTISALTVRTVKTPQKDEKNEEKMLRSYSPIMSDVEIPSPTRFRLLQRALKLDTTF